MLYSSLIERALRAAGGAHAGQVRKGGEIPYLTHLAGTAIVLLRASFEEETVIAAALLHDVIEDTEVSFADIERNFGPVVAAIVADASEIKKDANGQDIPWRTRKEEHLRRLATCPANSRAVVLADSIHNMGTMLDDLDAGAEIWTRFRASPEAILAYQAAVLGLAGDEPELQSLAEEGGELLGRLREHVA